MDCSNSITNKKKTTHYFGSGESNLRNCPIAREPYMLFCIMHVGYGKRRRCVCVFAYVCLAVMAVLFLCLMSKTTYLFVKHTQHTDQLTTSATPQINCKHNDTPEKKRSKSQNSKKNRAGVRIRRIGAKCEEPYCACTVCKRKHSTCI